MVTEKSLAKFANAATIGVEIQSIEENEIGNSMGNGSAPLGVSPGMLEHIIGMWSKLNVNLDGKLRRKSRAGVGTGLCIYLKLL